MHKIDTIRFGFAGGILTGLLCFVLTLIASVTGFGLDALNILKSIFIGYEISAFGSLIGAVYGFMAGFAQLFFLAFVYNLLGPTKESN